MATLITTDNPFDLNRCGVDEVIEPDFDDADFELAAMASYWCAHHHDNAEAA